MGIDQVGGSVHRYFVGNMEIEMGDVTREGKVDIQDLVHVASPPFVLFSLEKPNQGAYTNIDAG